VHLVTLELDGGPIILQRSVPVQDDDTVETLAARILVEEHRAYPEAVRTVLEGGWRIEGRRFVRVPGAVSVSRSQLPAGS
jgi:phosphoribosylglycinamide formyltransferase-1